MLQEPRILKYWTVIEHLREQIIDGTLSPGTRVPSLAEMQVKFSVSRATVEKAYTLLEQDGLLMREQGRGTFVAEHVTQKTTQTLGLLLRVDPQINFYTMDLLTGVREEAFRHGLNLLWLDESKAPDAATMDAILMCCHPMEAMTFNLPAQLPSTLLFQHSPDFTCVSADDFLGAKLATQHLLDLGHRRIAYLLPADNNSISRRRLAGYETALEEAGLREDESLIQFMCEPSHLNYRRAGELAMQRWFRGDWHASGCTAIFAHNDDVAISVMKVLREQGLHVPRDVSVIGFDGTQLSELSTPALTTIKVPLREIGAAAVKAVTAQARRGGFSETQSIVLPVQLQLGESTAPCKSRKLCQFSTPN